MKKLLTAAILSLTLLGCSDEPAPPTGDLLADYQRQYQQEHPYTAHQVARGAYTLDARAFEPVGAESGPPLVLMHGYPDSQILYDAVIPALRQERRVISFDFLGWGDSDKPAEVFYDSASLLADLDAVVDHFALQEVVLVVHDASGWPGIDWALAHPDRVAGLVILNSVYHLVDGAEPPEGLEQFTTFDPDFEDNAAAFAEDDVLWQTGVEDQLRKFFSQPQPRERYVPLLSAQSLAIRPAFFELASQLVPEMLARNERLDELAAFSAPVRVVFGEDDPYLNLTVAEDFSARFPNAVRRDVAGAGHYVQLDQPLAVAAEVLAVDGQ